MTDCEGSDTRQYADNVAHMVSGSIFFLEDQIGARIDDVLEPKKRRREGRHCDDESAEIVLRHGRSEEGEDAAQTVTGGRVTSATESGAGRASVDKFLTEEKSDGRILERAAG